MPVEFSIDQTADPDHLETVADALGARLESSHEQERTWFDTHDWRLHRAGLLLEHRRCGQRAWLAVSDLAGQQVARFPAPSRKVSVEDLPPGVMRERVEGLAGVRALLPRAIATGPLHTLAVLDSETKTVARVAVEGPTRVHDGPGLGVVARVEPLRGYAKQARRVAKRLERLDILEPLPESLPERVFSARGLAPGSHRSKPDLAFEPDQPVEEAFAEAFAQLLEILRDNLDGTLQQLDTEFLHDFRVTVRRTRSVLRFADGFLPDDLLSRHRRELKWLGRATSLSRDLDVCLLGFDEMAGQVATPEELAPFRSLLERRCAAAHGQLNRALRSKRFRRLLESWAKDLAVPCAATDPSLRVGEAATTLLKNAWQRVEKRGNAITDASPAEDVHDLRKACKELRYLLEVFASLYDVAARKEFVRELKRLQENLGAFQDAESQKFLVVEHAEELAAQDAPASTLMTMGRLEHALEERQAAARAEFARRWGSFDRRHTQRLYERMVGRR